MFIKNDNEFVCVHCGKKVNKLHYTSRDHCNYCLYSIHIDIMPGDRKNDCLGNLVPINIIDTAKKGRVIEYRCDKCGMSHKNISANDDDENVMYQIIENYTKGL